MAERPDHAEKMAAGSPGSDTARNRGCRCPVIDNHYGRGWHGLRGVYVRVEGCPVHCAVDCSE